MRITSAPGHRVDVRMTRRARARGSIRSRVRVVARSAVVAIFEHRLDERSRLSFVVAIHASSGRVTAHFMRPMTDVASGFAGVFTVVRVVRYVAIGAVSRQCPRFFVRPVAIRAVFCAVHVDRQAIALLFCVTLLAFPCAFANERPAGARWIVAGYAMERPHAGDAHAHVLVALHAHAIERLAKPFDFANVTACARRSRFQHRVDVMADLFGDFFPPCGFPIFVGMAATTSHRSGATVR